jgi:YVTN family beta-propeller protein
MAIGTDGYVRVDTIDLPGNVGGHGDWVAYDAATNTIWLAQSPDNNVVVIDAATNTIKATIPNIGNANGIDFSAQYAFVADVTNNTTDVIDKKTFQVVAKIPQTGTTPDGVAYVSSTNQVSVASDDANVLDFLQASQPLSQTASVQLTPNPSATGPDVQTYVPQKDLIYQPDNTQIDVIDPHTGTIVKTFANLVATGSVKPMVYDPTTNTLIVGTTNGQLLVLNADSGAILKTIAIPGSVDEGSIDVAARLAVFGDKTGVADIVNLDTDQLVGELPTQSATHTLAFDTANNDVYVYEGNSNTVDVFAPSQNLFGSTTTDVTSVAGQVYALYEAVLGRAPDAIGLETAVNAVNNGESLSKLARSLLDSSEYQSRYGASVRSDSAFVNQVYENALHRPADPAALATWDKALADKSLTRAQVAVDIATSPESQSDLTPTFKAGVFVPSETDSSIARLYYALLHRAPDAVGLQSFKTAAASGTSLRTIATDLIASPEFKADYGTPSNAQFVEALFEGAFGRSAAGDPSAQHDIHALNKGASDASMAVRVAESPEAVTHLSSQIETGFKLA